MIKLKSLIKEVGPKSSKDEETITIKHKTSEKEIVIVDTLKNRKKYTKMGYIIPLPKHLQKLIKDLEKRDREFKKYGVEVTDVIVPGLEWMNDIPEGVVKDFFTLKQSLGFDWKEWIDFGPIRFKAGLEFDVSILSIIGICISWYILRYFK